MIYLFPKLNALYIFGLLLALIISIIARNKNEKDKGFLIVLILLIFISRILLSLLVMGVRGADLTQDEGLYNKKALMKIFEMRGARNLERLFFDYFDDYDMLPRHYGTNLYTDILALFYYIFGYQIQAGRFINIFMNIIVFLLVFYVTKELFGKDSSGSSIAKISSTMYAFFPSLVLWSVMSSVDMTVSLCISAYIFSLIKIFKNFKFRWLGIMFISAFIIRPIRVYLVGVFITVAVITLIYRIYGELSKKGRLIVIVLVLLLIVAALHSHFLFFVKRGLQDKLEMVMARQKSFAKEDDSGYLIYPSYCYQGIRLSGPDFIKSYIKGMSYVLFSPFPWNMESRQQLMAYPQTILFYFMMPFILYGFYIGFKTNKLLTLSIFLYAFLVFSIFALVEGNVGALFRHKDMVTPFLLIYFAAGIYSLFNRHMEERFKKEGRMR